MLYLHLPLANCILYIQNDVCLYLHLSLIHVKRTESEVRVSHNCTRELEASNFLLFFFFFFCCIKEVLAYCFRISKKKKADKRKRLIKALPMTCVLKLSSSLSLTLSLSISSFLSHSPYFPFSLSLSLSHTHTHTLPNTLSLTYFTVVIGCFSIPAYCKIFGIFAQHLLFSLSTPQLFWCNEITM